MKTGEGIARGIIALAAAVVVVGTSFDTARAGTFPEDPFDSPVWEWVATKILEGGPVVFDERVIVDAPDNAEGNLQVPVSVTAEGLGDVSEIILIVDLNPILRVARFVPVRARPYFALRVKMAQASVIRAAARTADGVWHVGGKYVDASGGGCTTPSVAVASGSDWETNLNKVQARIWPRGDGVDRIRARIVHPMDTGLAGNIPAFFIEQLSVSDENGEVLAKLETFEPVSEDPVITIEITGGATSSKGFAITGSDNNGNEIDAWVHRAPRS